MLNWLKKPSVPSAFDLEGYHSYSEFTPDIAILEQKKFHNLFVYDRMMQRHEDHCLIAEHSVSLGKAFTKKTFAMFKRNRGIESYPVALEGDENFPSKAPIRGELYAVETPRFIELDNYRRNGIQFVRKRVNLILPYRTIGLTKQFGRRTSEVKYQDIWAFMYIGEPSFWNKVIDDEGFIFKEVNQFEPKNPELKRYYEFTKLEYNR